MASGHGRPRWADRKGEAMSKRLSYKARGRQADKCAHAACNHMRRYHHTTGAITICSLCSSLPDSTCARNGGSYIHAFEGAVR